VVGKQTIAGYAENELILQKAPGNRC
jgi:hypothetical protein